MSDMAKDRRKVRAIKWTKAEAVRYVLENEKSRFHGLKYWSAMAYLYPGKY